MDINQIFSDVINLPPLLQVISVVLILTKVTLWQNKQTENIVKSNVSELKLYIHQSIDDHKKECEK